MVSGCMSFCPTRTPTPWYDLPLHTWECGAPRREKVDPPKTDYFGDERRYLGRPAFGLHPLEDVCERIKLQAASIQQRRAKQEAERERLMLATVDLYRRLETQFGLYALEMCADLQRVSREEVSARLAAAAAILETA